MINLVKEKLSEILEIMLDSEQESLEELKKYNNEF